MIKQIKKNRSLLKFKLLLNDINIKQVMYGGSIFFYNVGNNDTLFKINCRTETFCLSRTALKNYFNFRDNEEWLLYRMLSELYNVDKFELCSYYEL